MSFMPMNQDEYGAPVMQDISAQRKLAQALLAQQDPLQGQNVSGIYVAPSWTQQLAQALKPITGAWLNKKADEKYKTYDDKRKSAMAELLKGNQAQTTQQGTTDTSTIPAYTPEQQDRFGSPLAGVQRQPVVTSTPNMVTETPEQVNERQQAKAMGLVGEYGMTPELQLALGNLNHQRDRGETLGDRTANWKHEDINHVRDVVDQRQNMAIQNGYNVDNQGREFAHADTSQQAGFKQQTNERLGSQGFQAGQTRFVQGQENIRSKQTNDRLSGDVGAIENNATMIATGKLPPLTGNSLRTPIGMKTMARVLEMNPDYNGMDYSTASKAQKDFGSGKLGSTVRSFNVSLGHLDTLDKLSDALNNKDTQAINKIGNYYATQTGQPAPTNFNAAKQIVGDEIVKGIIGAGGGVADREKAQEALSTANSPAQLKGVISTYKALMKDQVNGLKSQYKASTGLDDFDKKYMSEAGANLEHGTTSAHPQDDQAVAWARANPNNPKAAAILQANGVK